MKRGSHRSRTPHVAPADYPADAPTELIRVFVLDDDSHAGLGIRMRLRLEPDFDVIGEPGPCSAALEAAVAARPDVVVIDLQCVDIDGLAAVQLLRERTPGSAIVMLSIHDGEFLRAAAAMAGIHAFVAKHQADSVLLEAIRAAARRTPD